jgi:hypothetical protein
MSEPIDQKSLLTPRKVMFQVILWLAGLALLAWIVMGAFGKGGGTEMWSRIRSAPPALIAALLGCTLASALCNGTTFWITIQRVRPVRWLDMQLLNVVANALNYAPVRLGVIARIAYSLRVDRLSLIQIGGWFAFIGYVLCLGVGAALLATLVRRDVDWLWLAIMLGLMAAGGVAVRFVASLPLIARHARELDKMALDRRAVWGAIVLRVLDLGAYAGRMAAAMAILHLHLPWSHVIMLAMVALASSLMPVGRFGFREFCVAAVAARLGLQAGEVSATFKQLALLESAGEALVFIPLGLAAVPWFRRRWKSKGE